MSRRTSPYIVGDLWLDQRRDGASRGIWQIARSRDGTVVYRSTRKRRLEEAKAVLDATIASERALTYQNSSEALVVAILTTFWKERARRFFNSDQTSRSLRTFAAFLMQDRLGAGAVVTDLTPSVMERFREWRMGPHSFVIEWFGKSFDYSTEGVCGATVQRNINDIRAAIYYAKANMRISVTPQIRDLEEQYQSPLRERVLTHQELGRICWYAAHNKELFRFVALQLATAVRPTAALHFDPSVQYNPVLNRIDLQPNAAPQTKKRNAVLPAIRPLRPILRDWAADCPVRVASRRTAWRIMRRVLGLSSDVYPKTIRHTVATLLYADSKVPEREIVELLGHEGKLSRTSRIYAKYEPSMLGAATHALERIWLSVRKEARAYGADHILTSDRISGRFQVLDRSTNKPISHEEL